MLKTDELVNKFNSLTIAGAGDKPYIDQYDRDYIDKLYKDTGIDKTDDIPGEVEQLKIPGVDWENVKANASKKIAQSMDTPPPLPPIPGQVTEIPVVPYQGMTINNNNNTSTDMSDILSEKDWKEITKQAQEGTKHGGGAYTDWWNKHGPAGTVWYGPGAPYDLTE